MIYLDSAATAMQKPDSVRQAMSFALTRMASPGRGGHRPAMLAGQTAFRCRQEAAELFHLENPEHVVFTSNATHGLNIAIKTLVRPGDTVLISGYEHNAVTRPLAAIPEVRVKVADGPLFEPEQMVDAFRRMMTPEVSTVICTHVSNVFGYILPVYQIAELCRRRGKHLILDASQSAGCLPVYQDLLEADFIAMPGHKGLYGPQGTGLLLCGSEAVEPLVEGGTGSRSLQQEMPEFLPDRLEAGTHNVTGIAGLLEGIRYVRRRGTETILTHEQELISKAANGLRRWPEFRVYGAGRPQWQSGVCSFVPETMDCEALGEQLGEQGVAVRAGLHCAPLAHQTAGTLKTGTIRVSVSAFNTSREIELFLRVTRAIWHRRKK